MLETSEGLPTPTTVPVPRPMIISLRTDPLTADALAGGLPCWRGWEMSTALRMRQSAADRGRTEAALMGWAVPCTWSSKASKAKLTERTRLFSQFGFVPDDKIVTPHSHPTPNTQHCSRPYLQTSPISKLGSHRGVAVFWRILPQN